MLLLRHRKIIDFQNLIYPDKIEFQPALYCEAIRALKTKKHEHNLCLGVKDT